MKKALAASKAAEETFHAPGDADDRRRARSAPGHGRDLTMLTREAVLQTLAAERPVLAERYRVRRIGLFGSFASGSPGEGSDVDLVVDLEKPLGFGFVDLAEHLERVLGRKINLLTPAGLASMREARVRDSIASRIVYV